MIYEWTPEVSVHTSRPTGVRNFGDALIDILYDEKRLEKLYSDTENIYFLLGSVICNETIEQALRLNCTPVFYRCGARGEVLDPDLVKVSMFSEVRGPLTQKLLLDAGIDIRSSIDPGYNVPLEIPKPNPHGYTVLVPHMLDPNRHEYTNKDFGVDSIRQVDVYNKTHIEHLINEIGGARFVLTGSLHAAIIAHAYGVPFAPFSNGYVDCPFKWLDWSLSVGINDIQYFNSVNSGREWHKNNVARYIN